MVEADGKIAIVHTLDEKTERQFAIWAARRNVDIDFVDREQFPRQLGMLGISVSEELTHFDYLRSKYDYLQKDHFIQFGFTLDSSGQRQTAGAAFHALVDTRPLKKDSDTGKYLHQDGAPIAFKGIRTKTISQLGFKAINYDSINPEHRRRQQLANYAVEIASLIDSRKLIEERIDRGERVRHFTLEMIDRLEDQVI